MMKSFLQGLLIFFSMALCALIAFQWVRETELRKKVQELTNGMQDKSEAILNLQAATKRDASEIARLEELRHQLSERVKSNNVEIGKLDSNLSKAVTDLEKYTNQLESYKDAIKQANDNIIAQNQAIKQQNETITNLNEDRKKLAQERNDVTVKYNTLAKDFNALTERWNKQQEEIAMAATNSAKANPPKK